jgi:hypothetical protein
MIRASHCREKGKKMNVPAQDAAARFRDVLAREARAFAVRRAQAEWPAETIPAAIALITGIRIASAAELADPAVAAPVLAILRRDLRRERTKSRSRQAGYSFSRHLALFRMLRHVETAGGNAAPVAGTAKKERAGSEPAHAKS